MAQTISDNPINCESHRSVPQWTDEMQSQVFGDEMPTLDRLPRTAVYKVMASTAVWIAHEEKGTPKMNESIAEQVLVRI
ncbi:MAG: hypothetical protein ACYCYO_16255 [Bacilli bacterium]